MAVKFTPSQQQVIDLHGCNILVSAAAGSGKTAVLVERIVQMVCREKDPVDIDRLLVVTFTNAAAAEMKERISRAIGERLEQQPENGHLQRQAALLHNAQITTIDSFCLFVLRNNFNDIGLDPTFRVADQGEIELLRQEVMGQMLEERFAAGEEDFYHCVEVYCPGGKESVLEGHILQLYEFAMSQPWPEQWLQERRQDYRIESPEELERQPWADYLKQHMHLLLADCAGLMGQVVRLSELPDGPYMYGEMAQQEQEQLEKLQGFDTLEALETALGGLQFGRLSSKKDDSVDPAKRELAKDIRGRVKEHLKKIQETYFATPLCLALEQMQGCRRATDMLVELCLEFIERMHRIKREKKLLDFSDMEHLALQILLETTPEGVRPTKSALEYREYFAEVLIDEYQDSNLVQEYLLWAVSGEEDGKFNRFMVGDVKQSIYKFRLARPELFLEKYHTYETKDRESTCRRIDLCQNFRSRREVIGTVNQVFAKLMGKQLGGIEYDDKAALYEGAVYPENPGCESELILIGKPDPQSGISAKEAEALGIVKKIRQLRREFLVTDKATGQLRPVQYKDMVILLRTGSGWDEEFQTVFEREGIPAYVTSKTGYFSATEIQQILQFLKVLDNPLQDVPLFGVLRSVFGGFTDEEIAILRSRGAKGYLYENVEAMAAKEMYQADDGICAALKEKCAAFLKQMEKYRSYTVYMPIRKLLQTIFDEYGYLHYVAAVPGGEKRLANVQMLLEKAHAFEKISYCGLYHFIRYVEQLQKYNVDYGEANTLDENADVVRIMSIHKSKGLEFPVTFVAGLAKRFNMQDTAKALIVDTDFGLGTDYVDPDRRLKNSTLRKDALGVKMRAENLAEEIRVLYVAMTRAREKLILTGVKEQTDVPCLPVQEHALSYTDLYGASSYLDLLLAVLTPTEVLTVEELAAHKLAEHIDEAVRRQLLEQSSAYVDIPMSELLRDRFSYVYPHGDLAGLYTKTTVSELKMAALEEQEGAHQAFPVQETVPYIPGFVRQEETLSGTTRGSAFHKVMELLDFVRCPENPKEIVQWVGCELERLEDSGRLSQEYRQAISLEKICRFLDSGLARRMAAAGSQGMLRREQPFVYGISAARLSTGEREFPADETVLIQGIVDVFFEEEGSLVVADYKTDVINSPKELADRYRVQLDYYQEALEHLTGKPVKEKILYSFYLGCEIRLD